MTIAFDNSYARLPDRFFNAQGPAPVSEPALIAVNDALAAELGLDAGWLRSDAGLAMLAGNTLPEGAAPLAQAYAGHQFGGWVPQLGDGRALLIGEVIDTNGLRRDIQLKGSGPTPFSRRGDGRAGLGPVLREYIVSEAMHALGIPTTRALAAVTTGDVVLRERPQPGAVLTRVAASHIRVGTFQYFAAREDTEALALLAEHARQRHYPEAAGVLGFLKAVITAQAHLVARWLGVGFIHGVMNTDNMAVSGETIDYGPCAFMDRYHPAKVFSSIDQFGRYAYNKQPDMAAWDLAQLASALLPLIDPDENRAIEIATEAVNEFAPQFRDAWLEVFRAKVGLASAEDGDAELIHTLLDRMAVNQADFTNTFRALGGDTARDQFLDPAAFDQWQADWQARLVRDPQTPADRAEQMRRANPAIIPRNHRVEQAISAALSDNYEPFRKLLEATATPFDDGPLTAEYARPPSQDEEVHRTFCGT
ncbi:protein adenylyltransferase SelO [Actibacterium ureilyticum]|uniref:protein adenylyltransferase SelO n=1 Tax=Actibacterium ureilyticum TaxID=1590614 RepID=UPI000BAABE42|nr:YdiU family protein [Actibacterium ureilyticum]